MKRQMEAGGWVNSYIGDGQAANRKCTWSSPPLAVHCLTCCTAAHLRWGRMFLGPLEVSAPPIGSVRQASINTKATSPRQANRDLVSNLRSVVCVCVCVVPVSRRFLRVMYPLLMAPPRGFRPTVSWGVNWRPQLRGSPPPPLRDSMGGFT